ncbi:hypothetical protein ABTN59_20435, partial [Acinetobacter baumannii]
HLYVKNYLLVADPQLQVSEVWSKATLPTLKNINMTTYHHLYGRVKTKFIDGYINDITYHEI